jgi:peptidoglycan/LPS O-acetylase OafA/YrhL
MAENATAMTAPAAKKLPVNVLPLDALRFLSALWVCLYHGAKPPGNRVIPWFDFAWDAMLFGGTGVLAFFVISGFCIHYPAVAAGSDPKWGSYLTRRFVRVLIPYFAVLPFAWLTGRQYNMLFGNDLAWTILCDLAYYAMYPLLYHTSKSVGWNWLLAASFVASGVGIYLNIHNLVDIGTAIWIPIFLPTWVLGCVIAESYAAKARADKIPVPPVSKVNLLRALMIVCTPLIAALMFYKVVHWAYLGVPFGIAVTYWIWLEICYFSTGGRTVPAILTWLGTWIYSLYLTHPITQVGVEMILKNYFPGLEALLLSSFGWLCLRFLLLVGATFVAAYLFALAVEWPSHHLARQLSRKLKF